MTTDGQPMLERSVTITELATRVNRTRLTVWRWITHGVTAAGRKVKLRAHRVGGRWEVSPEEWAQFQADLNPDRAPLPESPAAERRRFAREKEALARKMGWLDTAPKRKGK